MSVCIYQGPYDPAPEGFPFRYVKDGWRGIERYYGPRTEIQLRWLKESGRDRLRTLRRRYLRGDLSALEEVRFPMQMAAE